MILFDAWQSLNAFVHLFLNANACRFLCCVRIKAKVDEGLVGELDVQFLEIINVECHGDCLSPILVINNAKVTFP